MTLGFSTKWPDRMGELAGQPNFFTNKIMRSMWQFYAKETQDFILSRTKSENKKFDEIKPFEKITVYENSKLIPKLHTIRQDPSDRWKAGMDIHFVINNRTKNRFQFAPVVKCVSVQTIEIKHLSLERGTQIYPIVWINGYMFYDPATGYDAGMEQFAINDGFNSVEDFFAYFNKDFKGKIIHWTDLKY